VQFRTAKKERFHMSKNPTYGDLFAYLRNHQRELRSPDPYFLVKRFLSEHGIVADSIIHVLEGFGGYDDTEVLMNAVGRIPADTPLVADVETPEAFAIRNGLHVYDENDGWSYPDLNAALTMMMMGGNHG